MRALPSTDFLDTPGPFRKPPTGNPDVCDHTPCTSAARFGISSMFQGSLSQSPFPKAARKVCAPNGRAPARPIDGLSRLGRPLKRRRPPPLAESAGRGGRRLVGRFFLLPRGMDSHLFLITPVMIMSVLFPVLGRFSDGFPGKCIGTHRRGGREGVRAEPNQF